MNNSLITSSFKYCEQLAKSHYENFPIASLFVPKDKRKYIYSVYAFARAADDFADEPEIEGGKEKRLVLLDEWNEKLRNCYKGKAYDPIFIALSQTVRDCKIPIEEFEKLLDAFRQDVIKNRYNNFSELLSYSKKSADPIGRIVMMIFGYKGYELFNYSDSVCTALQLINFWQDVEIDMKKDRVYIPEEEMIEAGYSYEDLFNRKYNNKFIILMDLLVKRTEDILEEGKMLIKKAVDFKELKPLIPELKLIWNGGYEIIKKLRKIQYNVFEYRPTISVLDKMKILFKSSFSTNSI